MFPYCQPWIAPTYFNFDNQPYSYILPQQTCYTSEQLNYFSLSHFPTSNADQFYPHFDFQNIKYSSSWQSNLLKTQNSLSLSAEPQIQLRKNQEKTKYGKKNAESNIINQTFSFVSLKIKNYRVLKIIFKNQAKKMEIFYHFLKLWKKSNNKYINRKYIKDLAELNQTHPAIKLFDKTNRHNILSKEQFRRAFRTLVNYYLQKICVNTIVTSSKLDKQTMIDHLQRRRQVHEYFNYHMSLTGFKQRNKN